MHSLKEAWFARNPALLCLEGLAMVTSVLSLYDLLWPGALPPIDILHLSLWLWFLVLLAHGVEACYETQYRTLVSASTQTRKHSLLAKKVCCDVTQSLETVSAMSLVPGEVISVQNGDVIPVQGNVINGTIMVAPQQVHAEDSPVKAGSQVVLGTAQIEVTQPLGEQCFDRLWQKGVKTQQRRTHTRLATWVVVFTTTMLLPLAGLAEGISENTHDWLWLSIALLTVMLILPAMWRVLSVLSAWWVQARLAPWLGEATLHGTLSECAEIDTVVLHPRSTTTPAGVAALKTLGLHTVLISPDGVDHAAQQARAYGVDDYVAQADAHTAQCYIKHLQTQGKCVAVSGCQHQDHAALVQADIGVMERCTETGVTVHRFHQILVTGRRLLPLQKTITSLSISTEIVQCFVILSALSIGLVDVLQHAQVMQIHHLYPPKAQIVTILFFHAVLLLALLPSLPSLLQQRCAVAWREMRKKCVWVGLTGILLSVVGIKLIDMLLVLSQFA